MLFFSVSVRLFFFIRRHFFNVYLELSFGPWQLFHLPAYLRFDLVPCRFIAVSVFMFILTVSPVLSPVCSGRPPPCLCPSVFVLFSYTLLVRYTLGPPSTLFPYAHSHVLLDCERHATHRHLLADKNDVTSLNSILGLTEGIQRLAAFITASHAFEKPPALPPE
jgi:hypothetical protein